ncbi:hypothetical protein CIB95_10635 [Lottiidibacillus patelloidae]|uniref:Aminoglycoside phosphotransferase domain-containing protein n=1 Tax=Lottiidibacillus patelloidae TaxID=2670334 RepID=A0A263BSH8_9BACI|nr:hypothetical protein [Lottiidibacillus patelloidae]OZM56673.1 hypothetical protein CIB95_10635 [Lottiidibacillus patelloidae]
MKHPLEKIDNALINSGFQPLKDGSEVSYLGEGAWHDAYLLTLRSNEKFVLRFPKVISVYGDKVEFCEKTVHAEYGGTKKYYELANKVRSGVCPEFFTYHAEENNTYTLETYKGSTVDLSSLTNEDAFDLGFQTGELFRGMHELDHGLQGFGYLSWNGSEIEGQLKTDVSTSMEEENDELISDYEALCNWDKRFKENGLQEKHLECLKERTIDARTVAFTNQDCSPENLLFNSGKLAVIDPLPILYDGNSLAGNVMNCYEAIFPTFYNTKRYEKHRFHQYNIELNQVADGFLEGYSGGSIDIKRAVRKEQFLKLANLCFDHYQLISGELSKSMEIRFGTKDEMVERLPALIKMLKNIDIS